MKYILCPLKTNSKGIPNEYFLGESNKTTGIAFKSQRNNQGKVRKENGALGTTFLLAVTCQLESKPGNNLDTPEPKNG